MMMNSEIDPTRHPAYHDALDWFLRLREQPESVENLQEFELWLQQDPMHETCYLDVMSLWEDLGQVEAANNVSQLSTPATEDAPADESAESPTVMPLRTRWRFPLATLVVCLMLTVILLPRHYLALGADYSTGTAERTQIQLEDGSRVQLNAQSAISVAFSENVRSIELLYGEAYFDVAKDPNRPFRVTALQTQIEAVGTAFNVRMNSDTAIETQLIEGRVRASAPDQSDVMMRVGQKLHWQEGQGLSLEKRLYSAQPGWTNGILRLDAQPLSQVVQQLNKHYGPLLQVIDPDLNDISVTGTMPLDNLDMALRLLEHSLEIRHSRLTDALVLLHR